MTDDADRPPGDDQLAPARGPWQPDGFGWQARIGVIVPHADLVPEAELRSMAPAGVSIHATRVVLPALHAEPTSGQPIELEALRAYVRPPDLDDAAALLAGGPLSVIAYAFTSTGYLGGDADDAALRARLEGNTNGLPVVTTCAAAVGALQALDVERVALVHPPWVSAELNELGARYFSRLGFQVVFASPAPVAGGPTTIRLGDVFEWARRSTPDDAQAVLFAGNGLRAIGLIDALERELDRPVLSANQVLLWAALRAASTETAAVTGYGRLFVVPASS